MLASFFHLLGCLLLRCQSFIDVHIYNIYHLPLLLDLMQNCTNDGIFESLKRIAWTISTIILIHNN